MVKEAVMSSTDTGPELREGDTGEWVAWLQRRLAELGHDPGRDDGEFGPRTERAVKAFQERCGLPATGVVDSGTWAWLFAATVVHEVAEAAAGVADTLGGGASAADFVQLCLSQEGKDYDYGVETDLTDPDPASFDCAELVEWALAQLGVLDGLKGNWNWSQGQRQAIEAAGLACSVDDARSIPGALLFNSHHVAVSLGTGNETIEAMGEQWNVRRGSIDGKSGSRFDGAGRIPGLRY
jgi:peptidoglycan hydrolase-like protein with peptidoglycan-binding domain